MMLSWAHEKVAGGRNPLACTILIINKNLRTNFLNLFWALSVIICIKLKLDRFLN